MLNRLAQIENEAEKLFAKMYQIEARIADLIDTNEYLCDAWELTTGPFIRTQIHIANHLLESDYNRALMDYDFLEFELEALGFEYDSLLFSELVVV